MIRHQITAMPGSSKAEYRNRFLLCPKDTIAHLPLKNRELCALFSFLLIHTWRTSLSGRWKVDAKGVKIQHPVSKRPILQFVSIKRKDCGEWAIPGVGGFYTSNIINGVCCFALNIPCVMCHHVDSQLFRNAQRPRCRGRVVFALNWCHSAALFIRVHMLVF